MPQGIRDGHVTIFRGDQMKFSHAAWILTSLALQEAKKKTGISCRDDIATIPDFIDFDGGRKS
jgi:hypothetical protein